MSPEAAARPLLWWPPLRSATGRPAAGRARSPRARQPDAPGGARPRGRACASRFLRWSTGRTGWAWSTRGRRAWDQPSWPKRERIRCRISRSSNKPNGGGLSDAGCMAICRHKKRRGLSGLSSPARRPCARSSSASVRRCSPRTSPGTSSRPRLRRCAGACERSRARCNMIELKFE